MDFAVLTDTWIPGVRCIPLTYSWPGWWAKMALFSGVIDRPCLYLDLDSLIVDRLDVFASARCPQFGMIGDFNQPTLAQSGVLMFSPGPTVSRIWKKWVVDPSKHMRTHRGDGEWLRENCRPSRIDRLFPGSIVSLKKHAREGIPEGARIVCGHGHPRLAHPDAGWAHEEWKARVRAFGEGGN